MTVILNAEVVGMRHQLQLSSLIVRTFLANVVYTYTLYKCFGSWKNWLIYLCCGKSVEVRGHCGNKFFLHVGTGDWTWLTYQVLSLARWFACLLTWFFLFFLFFKNTLEQPCAICSWRGVTQSAAPHTSSWWYSVQGSSPLRCSEAAVEWMQTLSRRAAVHVVFKANSVPERKCEAAQHFLWEMHIIL